MFDKENVEKENERFSSSILYVATAVYVGICAMVFGALYAKMPSFVEAFLLLMKDYGTVLAGIPVLVAVVVAKQQLDANRRQHVAMIKRSFKDNIHALGKVRRFSRFYTRFSIDDCLEYGINNEILGPVFRNITDLDLEYIKSHLDPSYASEIQEATLTLKRIRDSYHHRGGAHRNEERLYRNVQEACQRMLQNVDDDERHIMQYWS